MDSEQFNQIMRAMQSQNEIQRIQMLSMQQQITKINSKKNNDLEDGEVETVPELDHETLWKEEYYFNDFLNEFVKIKNTTFNQEKIEKELIPALLKVIRVIELGAKRYVVLKVGFADKENPIGNFIEIIEFNKFKTEYPISNGFGYRIPLKTSKGGIASYESCWSFHLINKMKIFAYRQMDWVPKSPLEENSIHKDIFNTFTGFDAQLVEEPDDELIKPLLDHFKIVWANYDEKYYIYILDWLATCVQRPREKIPAIIITGPQGCGKTLPVEFIMKKVFGHRCSIVQNNLDEVLDKYNSILANKFLVYVAETGGTTSKDGSIWGRMNQFKTLITDERIKLEAKYVNAYMATNYLHWILSSNHLDSIRIEPNDRRFQFFVANECYLGNVQYFKDLAASLTTEAADHFYTFLSQREITMDLKVFDTTAKIELRNLGLPNPVRFYNDLTNFDWIPANLKPKPVPIIYNNKHMVTKQEFFAIYKLWCLETGEKATNADWFYRHLKKHNVLIDEERPDSTKERYITISTQTSEYIMKSAVSTLSF